MKMSSPAAAVAVLALFVGSTLRADLFDDLRAKWADSLTGGTYTVDPTIQSKINAIDANAALYQSTMEPSGSSQPYLWSDHPNVVWVAGVSTANMTATYDHLAAMALALRTNGSAYQFIGTGSAAARAMRDDVKRGVQWMYVNSYQPNPYKVDPNWWDLEIGCTGWLGNILCYLTTGPFANGANGAFTQTDVMNYSLPMILKLRSTALDGSGANGVWKCRTWALLGMLRKNVNEKNEARDFLSEARQQLDGPLAKDTVIVSTWDSEGFRVDSSFYGHIAHAYTGTYGASFISLYLQMQRFHAGTDWALNGSATASLVDWITNGSDRSMFRQMYFQSTRGRNLTRYSITGFNGISTAISAISLADLASSGDALSLRQMVKEWLTSNPGVDLRGDAGISIPDYLTAKGYYDSYYDTTTARAVLDGYKQFTETSYATMQRPTFGASVAMFTKDTVNNTRPQMKSNETSNGETPSGAFLSNGALQVMTADFEQYGHGYYENIDWQRIPGTTIDADILPAGNRYENASNFAGGVVLGRYGVTGFELQPKAGTSETNLGKFHARKAWFFFDKEIVALGSDIRRTDTTVTHKIHTNVENWRIGAGNSNVFKIDDNTNPGVLVTMPGTLSSTVINKNGVSRAWLQGNVAGSDMGYYFPPIGGTTPPNINYRRDHRVSTDPKALTLDANFLTMWISHGVPSGGAYQYVMLPNQTEAATNAYANAPEIAVLENSADAQAVRKSSLGLTGVLFLKNQTKTVQASGVNFLTSDKIAATLVQETANDITVAVSDPTWENSVAAGADGQVILELNRATSGWETKSTGMTVLQTTPTIKIQTNVDAARGNTFTANFLTRYEIEKFAAPWQSSGDPYIVYTAEPPPASGGGIVSFNADAVNDYVTVKFWHQMPGTYSLHVRFKRANNRGKVGVSIGTDTTSMTAIGSQSIDLYNSATDFIDVTIANVTFVTAADRYLKFTVTGKNASSGGYRVAIDSVEFLPQ